MELVCSGVSVKYFGYPNCINDFCATFLRGINVLYGTSGSGKTTLLKSIAGIVEHSGDITLDGASVCTKGAEADVQMLFDDFALFNRHSVRYNLEYPLKIRKATKRERAEKVQQAVVEFGLETVCDTPVYRLNLWQKVALAMARTAIRGCKVLLLDNPFACLDVNQRQEAFFKYIPMLSARNAVVLYATDSLQEAKWLNANLFVINAGYLLQSGSYADIASAPATLLVQSAFHPFTAAVPCAVSDDKICIFSKDFPCETAMRLKKQGNTCIAALTHECLREASSGEQAKAVVSYMAEGGYVILADYNGTAIYISSDKKFACGETVSFVIDADKIKYFNESDLRRIGV